MKYHTKLLAAFLICIVLTNGLTATILYYVASRSLWTEVGNHALSIAATTAQFVDANDHKSVQHPGDEKTAEYERIKGVLKKARDANHRSDTLVANMYTMKPMTGAANTLAYGVDSEESVEDRSSVDQALKITSGRMPVLAQHEVDRDDFSTDQYGQWMSANVPIRDQSGKLIAAVGVDFPASFVQAKLNRLKLYSLIGFVLAVSFGSFFAFVYSARAGRQIETLKSTFVSYVSRPVLERVLKMRKQSVVHADRRKITVLFSDIRDFSKLSEHMQPEEVVKILNEYFGKMVEIVIRRKGMVDKFIGDGLMALFGAPEEDAYQEENAVYAALEMQEELNKLCKKWKDEARPPFKIGIGISSGTAIVGDLGSIQRLEYTAVGDTVNLASRIESLTKELKADVLISEYTYQGVKGLSLSISKKGSACVRGRNDSVNVYAVSPVVNGTRPETNVSC